MTREEALALYHPVVPCMCGRRRANETRAIESRTKLSAKESALELRQRPLKGNVRGLGQAGNRRVHIEDEIFEVCRIFGGVAPRP